MERSGPRYRLRGIEEGSGLPVEFESRAKTEAGARKAAKAMGMRAEGLEVEAIGAGGVEGE